MTKESNLLKTDNAQEAVIDGGFLQSGHWEKFQKSLGRKIARVENDAASALLIEHKLPLVGGYFFVPRGPVIKNQKSKITLPTRLAAKRAGRQENQNDNSKVKNLLSQIIDECNKNNIGWVRIEPQSGMDLEMIKKALAGKHQIKKSAKDHEPAQTIMIDLNKNHNELMAGMKPKTRYNIRLAEKKGVEIYESENQKEAGVFCDLVGITSKRDGVKGHPKSYYEKMLQSIEKSALKLFLAKYKKNIIAGALVSFHGGVATYLHGASANENRNVMAPHLLQWEIMKKAKELGCEKYDMGGVKIIENDSNKHLQWEGITRFKNGFCSNCHPVVFPGCWDIILNNFKYQVYRVLQQLKT